MKNNYINENFGNEFALPCNCSMSQTDIALVGQYIVTPFDNVKSKYIYDFNYNDNQDMLIDIQEDLFEVLIDPTKYWYSEWNEFDWKDFVQNLLEDYPYYIVLADGCGANICDDIYSCFKRSYDVTQYITGSNKDGSALSICESSHDSPMGYEVLIVGIDEATRNQIEFESENPFELIKSICEKAKETLTEVE